MIDTHVNAERKYASEILLFRKLNKIRHNCCLRKLHRKIHGI